MALTLLLSRLLLATIFIVAAPRHFTAEAATHAANLGVPWAKALVPISGAMALIGGLSVLLGFRADWGAWILVAFLLPVTLMMHGFWKLDDPVTIRVQKAMFLKNLTILGGLLLLTQLGSGAWSIDAARGALPESGRTRA
jgi:putative oxidoreductase